MSDDTRYPCALCGGPLRVQDNLNGGLISLNVDGHAKAAHRTCPVGPNEGRQLMGDIIVDAWREGHGSGQIIGAAEERARCIKVLEDLRGSRLRTSLAHDALNEAIDALRESSGPVGSSSPVGGELR